MSSPELSATLSGGSGNRVATGSAAAASSRHAARFASVAASTSVCAPISVLSVPVSAPATADASAAVASASAKAGRPLRWWLAGLARSGAALLLVAAPLYYFSTHYRIVYDALKDASCLPYRVFLVDLTHPPMGRGDYVAFVSRQMQPFYPDGTQAVKLLVGVPGDRVTVDEQGVWVAGHYWGELLHAQPGGKLYRMGKRLGDYRRDETVPAQHFWMMGTHPRSYDSRYWGYIDAQQVVGRAIPLW